MKAYNYILLDWDGTIAQTLNLWPDALDTVLRRQGIELKRSELIKTGGGVAALLAANAHLSEGEAVLEDAIEMVKKRLPNVELYPDVLDVLTDLKKEGKRLALVTSSQRAFVEPLLKKFGLEDLLDAVICAEDAKNRKPHPEPLLKALELLGGSEYEAIMIGDAAADIVAAESAGIDSVLFYPVEHQQLYGPIKLMKHNPTYVISDFWDLAKLAKGTYASAETKARQD